MSNFIAAACPLAVTFKDDETEPVTIVGFERDDDSDRYEPIVMRDDGKLVPAYEYAREFGTEPEQILPVFPPKDAEVE